MKPLAIREGGCTPVPDARWLAVPLLLRGPARRRALTLVAALVAGGLGYWWWCQEGRWTLAGPSGRQRCCVQRGWSEQQVLERCGQPDGRGWQPKVFASDGWRPLTRACSAPGDVFGDKVVLYDCDSRVYGVEPLPMPGFVYHSP